MNVHRVDPRTDPRWALLAAGPGGSLFTSPPWITAVCGTYGFTPAAAVTLDCGGRPRAGMSWVPVSDLRGDRLISMPFSDRAEPLATSAADFAALADEAVCSDAPFSVRCLARCSALYDDRFTPVGSVSWHGTDLHGDLSEMMGRISSTARRNLARARAAGVRVHAREDLAAIRLLHEMHVELRARKYRLLAQPLDFFEAVWKEFAARGDAVTLVAEHDGQAIAAALLLAWRDVVYYKVGASRSAQLNLRPNDAIFGAAIEWSLGRGARMIDWGISDDDQPGLIAFKDKWASHRDRVVTVRAGGQRAAVQADASELLGRLTALLTDPAVPTATTRAAGELLYRYFC